MDAFELGLIGVDEYSFLDWRDRDGDVGTDRVVKAAWVGFNGWAVDDVVLVDAVFRAVGVGFVEFNVGVVGASMGWEVGVRNAVVEVVEERGEELVDGDFVDQRLSVLDMSLVSLMSGQVSDVVTCPNSVPVMSAMSRTRVWGPF